MPPGNAATPTPAQWESAGGLLREARRRRNLTLIQVARRAHYSNHQVVHHWESNGPPWRDRSRLLTIISAYGLYRTEGDYLLALCEYPGPITEEEWQEHGDPPEGVQAVPSPGSSEEHDSEALPAANSGRHLVVDFMKPDVLASESDMEVIWKCG